MPERLSLPEAAKSTGWLYQLPESGPRESDTLTEGGVASYLKPKLPPFATFPALSEHVPLKDPLEVSGPLYVSELHDAIPDVASDAFTLIPSGWLYQPFASGPRALIPEMTGGVESFFTEAVVLPVKLPFASVNVAVHVWLTPVVSALCTRLPHPTGFETELPGFGVIVKLTVTVDLNQPPHDPPGEQLKLIPPPAAGAPAGTARMARAMTTRETAIRALIGRPSERQAAAATPPTTPAARMQARRNGGSGRDRSCPRSSSRRSTPPQSRQRG